MTRDCPFATQDCVNSFEGNSMWIYMPWKVGGDGWVYNAKIAPWRVSYRGPKRLLDVGWEQGEADEARQP
jgi:hypothetical protein